MDVSENSGVSPPIIHFNKVFHYKPSIWGTPICGNIHIEIRYTQRYINTGPELLELLLVGSCFLAPSCCEGSCFLIHPELLK